MTAEHAAAAFTELAAELAARGVVRAQMFGKQALKYESKAFACLLADTVAFRLGAGTVAHTEGLALDGAHLFDPSGRHRPMKDWVAVPVAHAGSWPHLADAALDRLAS